MSNALDLVVMVAICLGGFALTAPLSSVVARRYRRWRR
jgi:hypothetical protein